MSPQVQAIVLAAGSSSRMGRIKQLLPLPDRPAVRRCVESLLAGGAAGVIVVVANGSPVAAAIRDLPVRIAYNDDPASDMAGSVRVGLSAAPPGQSILVCLADHPLVTAATIAQVLSASAAHPRRIIIPRYQGRRGHPTFFPREIIDEVCHGKNLREVINSHPADVRYLDVGDEGVVLDMDTEKDYEALQRRAEGRT